MGYDGHGSTRTLTDALGAVTDTFHFDGYGMDLAWGRDQDVEYNQVNKPATDMLYSGEQYDTPLQMQYLRARYYDQNVGGFNRLDDYAGNMQDPQSLHKYAYCHGDPVNGMDPSGESNISELSLVSWILLFLATEEIVNAPEPGGVLYNDLPGGVKLLAVLGVMGIARVFLGFLKVSWQGASQALRNRALATGARNARIDYGQLYTGPQADGSFIEGFTSRTGEVYIHPSLVRMQGQLVQVSPRLWPTVAHEGGHVMFGPASGPLVGVRQGADAFVYRWSALAKGSEEMIVEGLAQGSMRAGYLHATNGTYYTPLYTVSGTSMTIEAVLVSGSVYGLVEGGQYIGDRLVEPDEPSKYPPQ